MTITDLAPALRASTERKIAEMRTHAVAHYTAAAVLQQHADEHSEEGSKFDHEADMLAAKLDEVDA